MNIHIPIWYWKILQKKIHFSKSPADRLKRCRIELEDYENPSVLKYIFSLPRCIDSGISAECSVNFKFLHLIKYSETFFGILKLFSYLYRSFCIRFFHPKCFPVKPEILKYIFSLKNYLDFMIFAELKFKFHRKKCYVLGKKCGIVDIHMKTIFGSRKTVWII